jgi:hypothetical protein
VRQSFKVGLAVSVLLLHILVALPCFGFYFALFGGLNGEWYFGEIGFHMI